MSDAAFNCNIIRTNAFWVSHFARAILYSLLQKGQTTDGKMPKPNYENMWQVTVKAFKAEDEHNTFVMTGIHRLTVTTEDLKFFPMGSANPISFPIISLRYVRGCETTCAESKPVPCDPFGKTQSTDYLRRRSALLSPILRIRQD